MAIKARSFLKALWITLYKPSASDFSDFFDSFVNLSDDLGDNTVLVKEPSASPVGLALTASSVLGRKATGNIVAISFTDLATALVLAGAYVSQGPWNATTNSPALASGVGTKGFVYKVSVAGATSIDGNAAWNVGDQIAFDGTTWDKWDGAATEVISFNTRTGAIILTSADITTALGYTPGTKLGHTIFTPTTGNAINLVAKQYNIIAPSGDLAALTLTLPAAPADGDVLEIKFEHAVTTITYTGGTVGNAIVTQAAGTKVKLMFDAGTSIWY